VTTTSLRTFCARNLGKIEKFAAGKGCKSIRQSYEGIGRSDVV